jgi:integrase
MLKINRDRRYYKTLGYETFEEYLGTPEISLSRGYVYKLIKNYELWVQKYHVSLAKLHEIDSEKLYIAGMIATKDNYEEWLEKAKTLSRSDIRGLIKGEDYEYKVTCPRCGYEFPRSKYNV